MSTFALQHQQHSQIQYTMNNSKISSNDSRSNNMQNIISNSSTVMAMTNTAQPIAVSVAPQSQGMVWDGSRWVTAVGHPEPQLLSKVELYTSYYHQWFACYNHFVEQQKLTNSNTTAQSSADGFDSQIKWAKYYSDLSSQAAHYFFNNPTAISAPFPLPPPPPNASGQQQLQGQQQALMTAVAAAEPLDSNLAQEVAVSRTTTTNNSVAVKNDTTKSDGTGEHALKKYVDLCLTQCTTSDEKTIMIQLIEKMIQGHLQNNTFETTVWAQQPLLQLPNIAKTGEDVNYFRKQHQHEQHVSGIQNKKINTGFHERGFNDHNRALPQYEGDSDLSAVGYYGPGVGAGGGMDLSSGSDRKYHNSKVGSHKSKKQKRHHHQQTATKSNNSSANSGASYYGPSTSTTTSNNNDSSFHEHKHHSNQQQFISRSFSGEEDFLSLSCNSSTKELKEDHSRCVMLQKMNTGFNNTNEVMNDRRKRFSRTRSDANSFENIVSTKDGTGTRISAVGVGSSTIGNEYDRFMGKGTIGGSKTLVTLDEADYEKMTIKGTCQTLEKQYLRLTAPPRAELVRPQPILEQHLKNLKSERYGLSSGSRCRDYAWFCSQLKAIRQDCTVQRIQNPFTIDVYETHAKIALEEDDLNEFNQCQTQLKELYRLMEELIFQSKRKDTAVGSDNASLSQTTDGLNDCRVTIDERSSQPDSFTTHSDIITSSTMATATASVQELQAALANRNEFISYRIIYHVFLAGNTKKIGGSSDLFQTMYDLTMEQRTDPAIVHALKVRMACTSDDMIDYYGFFGLYRTCPSPGGRHLMKHMLPTIRYKALVRICKGYKPGPVETDFVTTKLLGFESEAIGRDWLRSCNCVLSDDGVLLLTKDCNEIRESTIEPRKSSLI